MLISYLITTYNRPQQVAAAVRSVCREKGKFESELLIVNDNKDCPYSLPLEAVEVFGERLKCLESPINLGVIGARNLALSVAKGRYVLFLDDDDESYPNRTLSLLLAIQQTQAAFVAAQCQKNSAEDSRIVPNPHSDSYGLWEYLCNPPHINAVIWEREALLQAGGLDARIPYLGEHLTMGLWLLRGKKAAFVRECVANFGYQVAGLTFQHTSDSSKLRTDLIHYYNILAAECEEASVREKLSKIRRGLEQSDFVSFDQYLDCLRELMALS